VNTGALTGISLVLAGVSGSGCSTLPTAGGRSALHISDDAWRNACRSLAAFPGAAADRGELYDQRGTSRRIGAGLGTLLSAAIERRRIYRSCLRRATPRPGQSLPPAAAEPVP
jgi:hypothetical protein